MRLDKTFIRRLLLLAVPIAFQQLLTQGMYMLDSLMIGQLGQNEIIAVSAAGQIVFIFNVFLYGVGTSATVFTSQFWGKRDPVGVKKTFTFTLLLNTCVAVLFSGVFIAFPEAVISIVNPTPEIVALGAPYLRVVALAFPFSALTFAVNSSLKGMSKAKILMLTGIMTLLINAGINYVFIFGKLGMPKLGVTGAAIGTAVSFSVECIALLIYYFKRNGVGVRLRELKLPEKSFVRDYAKTGAPIMAQEALWSIGNLAIVMLYNRLGLDMAGAMAVFVVVEKMCYVLYSGLANSSAILVGNRIGAGERELAYKYAKRCLVIGPCIAVINGCMVILLGDGIMSLYHLTAAAQQMLKTMFYFMPGTHVANVLAFILLAGVLRGGGDTKFAAFADIGVTYLLGIPCSYLAGLVLKVPPPFVYLTYICSCEVVKTVVCFVRFKSRKWIHDITIPPSESDSGATKKAA